MSIPNSRMMGGGDQGSIAWRPGHTLPRQPQIVGGPNQHVLNGQHNVLVGSVQPGNIRSEDTPEPPVDPTGFLETNAAALSNIDWGAVAVAFPVTPPASPSPSPSPPPPSTPPPPTPTPTPPPPSTPPPPTPTPTPPPPPPTP